jgi:hypothetical protein
VSERVTVATVYLVGRWSPQLVTNVSLVVSKRALQPVSVAAVAGGLSAAGLKFEGK